MIDFFVPSGIFVLVALAGAWFFHSLKKRVQRQAACHAVYRVRDDLVCLVAEGKLKEDGYVFSHFYPRINQMLAKVPNVGIDDVFEAALQIKKVSGQSFQDSIGRARKEVEALRSCSEMNDSEVRRVVAEFYDAFGRLMLAHSSFSRFVYLRLVHDKCLPFLSKTFPRVARQFLVVRFALRAAEGLAQATSRTKMQFAWSD